VRAASIGDNSGGWEGLTVKGRRRWRSDGNRRGGGASGGGSWQGRHVGGGEGGARARAWSRGERVVGRRFFKRLGGAGQRGEKGGGPAGVATWQMEKEERGTSGVGGGVVTQQGGAADRWGWDEPRAQCQWRVREGEG
jgi:hypothetical protein